MGVHAALRVGTVTVPVGGGSAGVTTNHVTTYTYDGTDSRGKEERRGLVTRVSVTGLADQAGAYDETGTLVHEQLPGQIQRTRTYDTAGEPTEVVYTGPTKRRDASGALVAGDPAPWFGWAQANDLQGRVRAEWTPDAIGYNPPTGDGTDLPVTGQATGYSRVFTYDRAERLTRVLDYTRPGPGTGSTDNPTQSSTDTSGLVCVARAYAFDTRGRRTQTTSTTGTTNGTGTCPVAGAPATTTRTATYDAADRPLTGTTNLNGTTATGSYLYDTLGRQTSIPAVDSPAYTAGDTTTGPIQISYHTTDTARSISQNVTVRTGTTTGTTGPGQAIIERVQETTTLALDSAGRRQTETVTSRPVDATGTPTGTATTISTLTRHYTDSSDNPSWTYTDTPARPDKPAIQERSYSANGIGGYTATITSNLTGTLTNTSLNIANLHGDITTTIPLTPANPGTTPGQGPTASSITSWQHTDEYGNPLTTGPTAARTVGQRPGSATVNGAAYGWLGSHERALTTTGLTLMGARLYNPVVGNFTSTDPVPGGNTTAYTYPQDPINQLDLDGKAKWRKWAKAGIVIAGVVGAVACGLSVVCGIAVGAAVGAAYYGASHGFSKRFRWRGMGGAALTGGALGGVSRAKWAGHALSKAPGVGAKSRIFGNYSFGAKRAGLLNRKGLRGERRIGWGVRPVNGNMHKTFRYKTPTGEYRHLLNGRRL